MRSFLLAFVLSLSLFFGGEVVAQYGVEDALRDLNVEDADGNVIKPQHLAGTNAELEGGAGDITHFIQKLANGVAGIAGAVAVFFIVQNAFTLIMAAGNADKLASAKKGMIWALVGLLVVIGAYIVVKTTISVTFLGEEIGP